MLPYAAAQTRGIPLLIQNTRLKPIGFDQVLEGVLDGFIIIYDCDHFRALVLGHDSRVMRCSIGKQSHFGTVR